MDSLKDGEVLKVKVSDPGFYNDIQSWSKVTKNTLLSLEKKDGNIFATLQKGDSTNLDIEKKKTIE